MTTITDLEPHCVLCILSHISARDVAKVSCAISPWAQQTKDEHLWSNLLLQDYASDGVTAPDGSSCSSSKAAYVQWIHTFSAEYLPYVKRAVTAWNKIKSFLAANFQPAMASLQPGVSEESIAEAEEKMGLKLPTALKVIYRLHNGQSLLADQKMDSGASMDSSLFHGLFGGYYFYENFVSLRLLPVERMAKWTVILRDNNTVIRGKKNVAVPVASYNFRKFFSVDCSDASVSVSTRSSLLPATPSSMTYDNDGVLVWFEEYARRLETSWYEVAPLDDETGAESTSICLFPLQPPIMVSEVTRGVQVRATTLFVPEMSVSDNLLFTYSIRYSLLEPDEQLKYWPATAGPPRSLASCQLLNRHWIIKDAAGKVADEVEGPGVIGKYPILKPGGKEFVYQSCTYQQESKGSMEGTFGFVEGSRNSPTGGEWDVVCPTFQLQVPDFIY